MPNLSKARQPLMAKSAGFVLPFLLLAACGSTPPGQPPATAGTQRLSGQVEAALCEGRADDAYAILSAEPLSGPADRFYTALALEKSGRSVSARKIYASLMQSGSQATVFLRCGNDLIASGTVSDEAARRLASIAQDLRAMDVAAPLPQKLHAGLPTLNGGSGPSAKPASGYGGSGMTVYRPASTSPLGQWFAHLESYKTYQTALASKPKIEARFPALKGYIDQWEVGVSGGVVRLGVRLDNREDARRLCQQVKSNGHYCAVLDTNP